MLGRLHRVDTTGNAVRLRARVVRVVQAALRLAVLAVGRMWPVIPISRLLDVAAWFGATRPRDDRPHVMVVGYDDFCTVLGDHESFAVPDYTRKMAVLGTFLLGREFTPAYLEEIGALRRAMPGSDRTLIGQMAEQGAAAAIAKAGSRRLDVGRQLAQPVLLDVVERYFGVPAHDTTLFDWFDAVSSYVFTPDVFQAPDSQARAESAGAAIARHLAGPDTAKLQASASAADTVLYRLAHDPGPQPLAANRVLDTVAGTLAGTLIPTFQEFVQVIDVLLDLPPERFHDLQMIARSAREDLLLPSVLEAARFSPRPPLLARECVRPTAVRGRSVRPHTVVFAVAFTAAFDWTVAPRPWRFRAGRPPAAYPIFGHGQHHCVGATLERPIAQVVLTRMAIQLLGLPGLRRARGPLGRAGLNGRRLFVEWD